MNKILFLILLIAAWGIFSNSFKKDKTVAEETNEVGQETWTDGREDLEARLNQLGMPALKEEGSAVHTHQHLTIYIDGQIINIPENIGVGPDNRFIAQIHTHDKEGIIHVESPTVEKFYLGQFFDVWGIRLDEKCLGNFCEDAQNQFEVYSNGEKIEGNPRELELTSRQQITMVYGSESDKPSKIPSSYEFPKGY